MLSGRGMELVVAVVNVVVRLAPRAIIKGERAQAYAQAVSLHRPRLTVCRAVSAALVLSATTTMHTGPTRVVSPVRALSAHAMSRALRPCGASMSDAPATWPYCLRYSVPPLYLISAFLRDPGRPAPLFGLSAR